MAQDLIGQTVFLETSPFFLVDDVFATAEHYRDKLGFQFDTFFGEPPAFVIVKRNTTRLMFRQVTPAQRPSARSNVATLPHAFDAYVWVSDVDALASELKDRGADVLHGPDDTDSPGRREMLVRDLNGYVLCFGRVLGWPD